MSLFWKESVLTQLSDPSANSTGPYTSGDELSNGSRDLPAIDVIKRLYWIPDFEIHRALPILYTRSSAHTFLERQLPSYTTAWKTHY